MKKMYFLLGIFLLLILLFLLGPKMNFPEYNASLPTIPWSLDEIETQITERDKTTPNLKPNNQGRIVWADSIKKTPYALVYLHGYSASPMEGDPVHLNFAKRYGCNLYVPRLSQHGIKDQETFKTLTPKDLIADAKEALAIGKKLGGKVILMSCSTGSTLSIYLATEHPELVHSMIMYSPNLNLADPTAALLTKPWGLSIARKVIGEHRELTSLIGTKKEQYTTCKYRVEGLICLKTLLEETMTDDRFKEVTQPYFIGYYYKNEKEKDNIIDIDRIKDFDRLTSSNPSAKQVVAFPDAGTHVLPSDLYNPHIDNLEQATFQFADSLLGLVKE